MLLISSTLQAQSKTDPEKHLQWVQKHLDKPAPNTILISAHRGDWRNSPENSIQNLKNCIEHGYDIIEIDLGVSKDSVLMLMHDKTIDRTTTGKGKISDYTVAELKQFRFKNGGAHATRHQIPTLEEYLKEAKGKAVLCFDKGFEYFEQAMALVQKYQMTSQVIYLVPSVMRDSLQSGHLKGMSDSLALNLISFPTNLVQSKQLLSSYHGRKRVIFHPTFSSDTIAFVKWMPAIKKAGVHLWVNSLWPEHNGGHDDDRAVEMNQPDKSWGWLIENGVTIIQTDRP